MKNILKKLVCAYTCDSGFGLIEVIIGITMLILTATAALSLSSTSIRAEAFNNRRVVAYNLGQQIMEETRRMRDSAWDDLDSGTRWLIDEDDLIKDLDNYTGEAGACGNSDVPEYAIKCDVEDVQYYINLEAIDVDLSEKHGKANEDYTPANSRGVGVSISERLAKRIFIDVMWTEAGSERHLELISLLTDWKPAI